MVVGVAIPGASYCISSVLYADNTVLLAVNLSTLDYTLTLEANFPELFRLLFKLAAFKILLVGLCHPHTSNSLTLGFV